jgi:hypothetical protein
LLLRTTQSGLRVSDNVANTGMCPLESKYVGDKELFSVWQVS